MIPEELTKWHQLQLHCKELVITRMYCELIEAEGMGSGWSLELLDKWKDYNGHLMRLQQQTRTLLPF